MDQVLLRYFTDSLQHKLDLIVLQFPDSKTIKNDIYRWIAVDCGEEQVLASEGGLRLIQSAINRFECKYDDSLELLTAEFSALFALFRKHLQKCRLLQWNDDDDELINYDKVHNLLQPLFVCAELNAGKSIEHSLTFHRNCCLYLYTQLNLASAPVRLQESVIQYLSTLLNYGTANYDFLYLILKLLQNLKSSWSRVKIMVGMDTLASYFDINNLSNLYSGQTDYKRYLVGFEARWLIDNVMTNKPAKSGSHLVKMDSSKLTVQGQQQVTTSENNLTDYKATITTVLGSSAISYYEALLLSSGFMSIGWTTKEAEFSQWRQVGADRHSIGFDGFHKCAWHNNQCHFVSTSWKVGDIIGCSVDSDKKVFTFYLNGTEVLTTSTTGHFSTLKYVPAVSLTKDQLCCLNFGQTAFKYNSKTHTKTQSYLLAPVMLEQSYWFKENSTELFYDDAEQQDYNQMIIDLETNLNSTSLRYQSHLQKLESRFVEMCDSNKESSMLRMCQAILTHMSSSITGKKIDWIRWLFMETVANSSCDSGPSTAKFIEFLYPYLTNEHTLHKIKRRNISLVLSIVVQKYGLLCDMLTEEVGQFLVQTILESDGNKLAVLFALITLNSVDLSSREIISPAVVSILTREKFLEKLKKRSSYVKKARFLNLYTLDFVQYQIAFCARSVREQILTHLLSSNDLSVSSIDDVDLPVRVKATAVLSCQYMSSGMQLSPDQLSARSDRRWQTVLAADNVPLNDEFYCEVILLTCGPMRIGFIAEETMADLESPLGSSDVSSVSFDGFHKVIWCGRKRWPLGKGTVNKVSRWKSGDVVGCEMDLTTRRMAFYLNGRQVQIPLEAVDDAFWQSEGNYYLALTLGNQSHCLCNFGQKPFRYAKT